MPPIDPSMAAAPSIDATMLKAARMSFGKGAIAGLLEDGEDDLVASRTATPAAPAARMLKAAVDFLAKRAYLMGNSGPGRSSKPPQGKDALPEATARDVGGVGGTSSGLADTRPLFGPKTPDYPTKIAAAPPMMQPPSPVPPQGSAPAPGPGADVDPNAGMAPAPGGGQPPAPAPGDPNAQAGGTPPPPNAAPPAPPTSPGMGQPPPGQPPAGTLVTGHAAADHAQADQPGPRRAAAHARQAVGPGRPGKDAMSAATADPDVGGTVRSGLTDTRLMFTPKPPTGPTKFAAAPPMMQPRRLCRRPKPPSATSDLRQRPRR